MLETQTFQPLDFNRIQDFATFFCQEKVKYPIPPVHNQMYELLMTSDPRLVFCMFRGGAKSTVCSEIYPTWEIVEDRQPVRHNKNKVEKIILVSETLPKALEILSHIKDLLTNEWVVSKYGDGRTDKWTLDHIIWKRQDGSKVEVLAKGAGSQIRGFRPQVLICDDLENNEAVRSGEQREKLEEWFNKEVINTLLPDDRMVYVGTLLHPVSLLAKVMDKQAYTVRKWQAITPEGTALWPDQWPLERLEQRRAEIGEIAFNSEFMNEPVVSENPIFYRSSLRWYDHASASFEKEVERGLYTVIAVDPAISKKETADYTAIVSISTIPGANEPRYYVRVGGVVRGHWPINKTVQEAARLYEDFHANAIVIETVAFQEALADEFERYMNDRRVYPVVQAVKPDTDKERRAVAIAPLLSRGEVYFDENDVMTQRLVDELLLFPTGDHDDLVDAFVYALGELKAWGVRASLKGQGPKIVLPSKPRAFTGVAC